MVLLTQNSLITFLLPQSGRMEVYYVISRNFTRRIRLLPLSSYRQGLAFDNDSRRGKAVRRKRHDRKLGRCRNSLEQACRDGICPSSKIFIRSLREERPILSLCPPRAVSGCAKDLRNKIGQRYRQTKGLLAFMHGN